MSRLKSYHQQVWQYQHSERQSQLLDRLETGEITEIEAEYLDDLDNAMQAISINTLDFAILN